MSDYSPKRRTALVFTGVGSSGAYHAGVLRALDESGVKVDLVVGSGIGTLTAAFSAVAGGAKLYGPGGFWHELRWAALYRLRPALRVAFSLVALSFGVFLLPILLAFLAGLLFPLLLVLDLVVPMSSHAPAEFLAAPAAVRGPYLAALAVPSFLLSAFLLGFVALQLVRNRRRIGEAFEYLLDAERGRLRLCRCLWEIARGAAISETPPAESELSRRYVALVAENVGQPGFREVILRAGDLETGRCLSFVLLADPHRASFIARAGHSSREGRIDAVDLRAAGCEGLFFDALITGLLPPLAAPIRRVSFPRAGAYAGETHRLTDATLFSGCGISEALAAGAQQVIMVTGATHRPVPLARRRGPRALADGILAGLERRAVSEDMAGAERINALVEASGGEFEDGQRVWRDPTTGRLYRDLPLYVIRPGRKGIGPLELDGARDPVTEVEETLSDLEDQGYKDAYRMFVEPIVGAAPEPKRPRVESEEGQPVEL